MGSNPIGVTRLPCTGKQGLESPGKTGRFLFHRASVASVLGGTLLLPSDLHSRLLHVCVSLGLHGGCGNARPRGMDFAHLRRTHRETYPWLSAALTKSPPSRMPTNWFRRSAHC